MTISYETCYYKNLKRCILYCRGSPGGSRILDFHFIYPPSSFLAEKQLLKFISFKFITYVTVECMYSDIVHILHDKSRHFLNTYKSHATQNRLHIKLNY